MRHKDYGFGDQDIRMSKLSQLCDPLDKFNNKGIDFDLFRSVFERRLSKLTKGKSGCLYYVLIFKALILQRYYNSSNDQVEY